jgi:cobalamin synthase
MTIAAAFKFLTLAEGSDKFDPGPAGLRILYLPFGGLLLGLVLVIINRAAEPYLASEVLAVVLIAVAILATGAHHLAGLQKTLNELPTKDPPASSVQTSTIYGLLAVLLVVLFKTHSIEVIGESRAVSLLLTPLLARWALFLFLFGSVPLPDNAGARIAASVRAWHLIVVSVATLGFAFLVASTQALWVALFLSLLALLARAYLLRRQAGVSLANCGALIEVSEALSLTLLASL